MATWVKRMGGAGADQCEGVAVDLAGNVVVTGSFSGAADFGQGPLTSAGRRDAFLVKIDPGGAPVWSKRFGSSGDDVATSVAVDAAGNVFVAGYADLPIDFGGGPVGAQSGMAHVFVAAFGPGGELKFARAFRGGGEHLRPAVTADAAGAVFLTGHFEGEIDFGGKHAKSAGKDDVFVVKISPVGELMWARTAGGAGTDTGSAIAVDPAGHVIVAGESEGPIDFGQGPIGTTRGHQGYVVALDGGGAPLWGRAIGARGEGGASGLTIDAAGMTTVVGVAVEASGSGIVRTFVAQLDPAGHERWMQNLGDAGTTRGVAVAEDVAGNVLVAGGMTAGNSEDAFLARFDPGGHRTGLAHFGGAWSQTRTVAFDKAGQMVIGGSFAGRLAIAGGALDSAGDRDIFVARLPPHGVW
jgi:hypothetical protein